MSQSTVGIIGATGFATERMLPELKKSTLCKITGLYARNITKLTNTARIFDIDEIFTDLDNFLKNKYDLVYVATPPFLHFEQLKKVLESESAKNILCEKPIVLNKNELDNLVKLKIQYPDVNIFIGHHIRNQKAIFDLKNIIKSKKIGEILYVNGDWSYELDPSAQYADWKLDQRKGGNSVMGDPGIHIIDLIYTLFGNPKTISVSGSKVLYKTTFDNVVALLGYEDKQIVLRASQTTKIPINDLVITGINGRIEIKDCFSQTYIKKIDIITKKGVESIDYEETYLYKNEVENILQLGNVGIHPTTFNEAIEETKILIKINELLI